MYSKLRSLVADIMNRNGISKIFAPTFLLTLFLAHPAWAYIDPNTTHTVFSALGSMLIVVGVILNILFWPILFLRKKIKVLFQKLPGFWKVVVLLGACLLITAVAIFVYKTIF